MKRMTSLHLAVALVAASASMASGRTLSDTLLPSAGRTAGAPLNGVEFTEGIRWRATKEVIIGDQGVTAGMPGTAHFEMAEMAGRITVRADVLAEGSAFTGIALGRGNLSADFWKGLDIMLTVRPRGFNVFGGGKELMAQPDKSLLKEGINRFEFTVDTLARTAAVVVNGKPSGAAFALPENIRLDGLTAVGLRFHEPVSGNPVVRNLSVELTSDAVAGLVPTDHAMCLVVPDEEAVLSWKVGASGPSDQVPYTVTGYAGASSGEGVATVGADGLVKLTRAFPAGYWEIGFPEARQTFGVISLPARRFPADRFFCMDAGLSWLELDPAKRDALVRIMARCGISAARERMGVGNVSQKPGTYDWETARAFGSLRKTYQTHGVQVLEMLDGGKHSRDLAKMSVTLTALASHWEGGWNGAEVWNEPDLRPVPADQYVPLGKVTSYAMKAAGSRLPVVSGAFATIPPGPYFDTSAANGLLEDSDAVSFHSYDRAPSVEGMVARYRKWLADSGKEAMPLWHSECGWPWANGPGRPPQAQDADSAMEIAAKTMESKAAGVARHFPFVMTYYEEGLKNFGMMGREVSPLRSMAAYAACIRLLEGKGYLGDLGDLDPAVKLARVFGREGDKEWVAVLYTGKSAEIIRTPFSAPILKVEGVDGRVLPHAAGTLEIPDGMVYVTLGAAETSPLLAKDAPVRRLFDLGKLPRIQERRASPVILQSLPDEKIFRASSRRYLVSREAASTLPVRVRVHNLSPEPLTFTPELALPGKGPVPHAAVTLPAEGFADVAWTLDASGSLDIAATRLIRVSGKSSAGIQPLPLALPVVMEGDLEQHLARHPTQRALPITDLSKWTKNIAGHGRSTFSASPEGGWKMDLKFTGEAGNWTYPKLELPEKIDPQHYSGFLLRARIPEKGDAVAMIASTPGAPSFWVSDLFPADGNWHVVYVPFAEFKPGPGGAGNQNTRLDPAGWGSISIGMNSRVRENAMEVSHLLLVGGAGE